jgi:hypothetical protein
LKYNREELLSFSKQGKIREIYIVARCIRCEAVTSVSIVAGYGLDDRKIEVRSPAEEKRFFLYPLCLDQLWGPPSFLFNGYRVSFPRG